MLIYEKIKEDLKTLYKDPIKRNFLRYIIGEFQRLSVKEVDDVKAVKLLKKLIKDSEEVIKLGEKLGREQDLINLIKEYLPEEASKEEIRNWILNNINFEDYKDKMQIIKPVMEYFGARSNGNIIRGVIMTIDK